MKTLYKNIIFSLAFICVISCNAQQYPLNTLMENIPQGGYVKDLNNELNPYVGTYRTNFNGNEITLFITKQENKYTKRVNKTYFMDVLVMKYIIKNSSGQILQDTQNGVTQLNTIESIRSRPNQNTVILYYEGTNCGVGWGKIILKKINATQVSWFYGGNHSMINDQNCSGNPDTTIYLPDEETIIFTKQ
ncbi:hypothetical protein ASG22_09435 [Chryseobacterium sp. Leaf405]|uniref:DUF6705 family protein n=1 Tax=Chryseobacterium sp. Leaf405 TaxID=1736367 RepID=UPI0006F6823F|nr:DUF6705 family protein [Chryseobacterium sp. Leaf405]KQT24228.1 hypothetical protein ASG22_09435 [Chryseobacterium sp. Leaf405]